MKSDVSTFNLNFFIMHPSFPSEFAMANNKLSFCGLKHTPLCASSLQNSFLFCNIVDSLSSSLVLTASRGKHRLHSLTHWKCCLN